MKILAVDTSAKTASIAIVENDMVSVEYSIQTALTHSQTLMPMIESALKLSKTSIGDIDAFACAAGPGSFTGLRIGIGAIKGLAYGSGKPCIGISTLNALAFNLKNSDGIICAVMDARCGQVYNALFESDGRGKIEQIAEDRAITISDLTENIKKYTKNIFLVGDGANLCYNYMNDYFENIVLANELVRCQHAASVGILAAERLNSGLTMSPDELVPCYLRLPQAQRELLAKKQ